jgi:uncharacterized protein DUF6596
VRVELCREALRLVALLVEHPLAATPATHALAALMCLHAALCAEGQRLLDLSASGSTLTEYHVEAAIGPDGAPLPRAARERVRMPRGTPVAVSSL